MGAPVEEELVGFFIIDFLEDAVLDIEPTTSADTTAPVAAEPPLEVVLPPPERSIVLL